jgi:hypothetical protein
MMESVFWFCIVTICFVVCGKKDRMIGVNSDFERWKFCSAYFVLKKLLWRGQKLTTIDFAEIIASG